jgi:large subunit ribosomal protein L6
MSRIGKQQTVIPTKTEVSIAEKLVTVTGPLGTLTLAYRPEAVAIKVEDNAIIVEKKNDELESRALWGTYSSELASMVEGVHKAFQKKLIIEGVGYKAEMRENTIVLSVGFSHQVPLVVPEGVTCIVEKNVITISGTSKEKVGQFAAVVRSQKKPEPYKGKGIRYDNEVVRRKEGKKAS